MKFYFRFVSPIDVEAEGERVLTIKDGARVLVDLLVGSHQTYSRKFRIVPIDRILVSIYKSVAVD